MYAEVETKTEGDHSLLVPCGVGRFSNHLDDAHAHAWQALVEP